MTYEFEASLSQNMDTPDDTTSIHALNGAYAVLVRTLDDKIPGFADELLANLDRFYNQNEGQHFTQLAIAQIGVRVKTLTSGRG
ncbi:hypothetical protein [Kosakonia cowanii]|uniref:hypothetical protein n=1 Tax=Kosakonia cowanii TaxID=208223 RepID=UPI002FDF0284